MTEFVSGDSPTSASHGNEEADRLTEIYSARGYDADPKYSDLDAVYFQRSQSIERGVLRILRECGVTSAELADMQALDFGCGNGRWLGRFVAWGALARNLAGVDIRPAALDVARQALPAPVTLKPVGADGKVEFDDGSFDLILVNLVFSSILDGGIRREVATEVRRLLRPGGLLVLCDFVVDNPRNPNVRALRKHDTRTLFADLELESSRRIVLAPPLARFAARRSCWLADTLELVAPLRSHRIYGFRTPA